MLLRVAAGRCGRAVACDAAITRFQVSLDSVSRYQYAAYLVVR